MATFFLQGQGMRPLLARFTIRDLMVATMIMAGLLALPGPWRGLAASLTLPCISLLAARWILLRRRLQLAGICFWAPAVLANASYVALCISPTGWLPCLLVLIWLFMLLPTLVGFGITWATLSTREVAATRRPSSMTWVSVVAMWTLPLATAMTLWPLRLVFLTVKPALERLSDQVSAGRVVAYPQRVGPFRVAGSVVDPATGAVGLLIDANPNGPTALVRNRGPRLGPFGCYRPVRGDVLDIRLGDGWCYHVED